MSIAYDPETGIFTTVRGTHGTLNKVTGYLTVWYNGKNTYAHRLAWELTNGPIPEGYEIDHIDNNPLNNAISNLRLATRAENLRNRGTPKNNTSGVKGVTWSKVSNKWMVQFRHNKKYIYFGCFEDIELAILVADEARERLHGEFVCN